MFVLVLCLALTRQVLTREQLPPPQDVHVDQWQLNWTPAAGDRPVQYTVQYNSLGGAGWQDVPGCVRIASNSCDTAAAVRGRGELGCVRLQLWAESGRLRSEPVEACSRHGASCTPDISLTALPGSLTVHLSRSHSLAEEYADNARHAIYFGKEGEPLEHYADSVSSVTVSELQAGQRYCMKVQYVLLSEPVGLPSCPRCERIPQQKPAQTGVIVAVVVVVLLTATAVLILYVLIFHYKTLKLKIQRWFQPYKIPIMELKPSVPPFEPPEESYDPITVVSLLQHDE